MAEYFQLNETALAELLPSGRQTVFVNRIGWARTYLKKAGLIGSPSRAISKYGLIQSMNRAGGRCHDNARCESMWARLKEELLYHRYDASKITVETVRTLIWRYFISYWNNRRICSANGGLPPMIKRQQYYNSLQDAT